LSGPPWQYQGDFRAGACRGLAELNLWTNAAKWSRFPGKACRECGIRQADDTHGGRLWWWSDPRAGYPNTDWRATGSFLGGSSARPTARGDCQGSGMGHGNKSSQQVVLQNTGGALFASEGQPLPGGKPPVTSDFLRLELPEQPMAVFLWTTPTDGGDLKGMFPGRPTPGKKGNYPTQGEKRSLQYESFFFRPEEGNRVIIAFTV